MTVQKSTFTHRYDRFRQLLLAARKRAGLTQQVVADRLGKPQSFVAKYENGERRLDVVEFLAVAAALEVDPVKLLRQLIRLDS